MFHNLIFQVFSPHPISKEMVEETKNEKSGAEQDFEDLISVQKRMTTWLTKSGTICLTLSQSHAEPFSYILSFYNMAAFPCLGAKSG